MDARHDPRAEYTRRLTDRRADAAREARLDDAAVRARQALVALAAVLAWLAYWSHAISPWWLAAPAGVLVVLAVAHGRVIRRRRLAERRVAFYERGLARLDGRWAGQGVAGNAFLDHEHRGANVSDDFPRGPDFYAIRLDVTTDLPADDHVGHAHV